MATKDVSKCDYVCLYGHTITQHETWERERERENCKPKKQDEEIFWRKTKEGKCLVGQAPFKALHYLVGQ